jgi:competence ComEA-like helix-hairpin-helix protein
MKIATRIMMVAVLALTIVTGATLDGLCAARAKKAVSGVLNINTATAQEWTLFPGVGKAKADAIMAERATAQFASVDDLAKVKGIGPKFIEKFRSNLSVSGASTIQKSVAPDAATTTASAAPTSSPAAKLLGH